MALLSGHQQQPPFTILVEKNKAEGSSLVRIHSKCVPNPQLLVMVLRRHIGVGNYKVEMKHNVYTININALLDVDQIDPVRRCMEARHWPGEPRRVWLACGRMIDRNGADNVAITAIVSPGTTSLRRAFPFPETQQQRLF
jgi:hypothetical protein